MIHGWGTKSYNSNIEDNEVYDGIAWKHRHELIGCLERKYSLKYFNLPGFCGVAEPHQPSFNLEDFADYFAKWLENQNTTPAAIIGYSFGGALALEYKVKYRSDIPVILISAALKRKETAKSHLASLGKHLIPEKNLDLLRSFYQTVFSRYYREGTPFLRNSYDKIARRDVRHLLTQVDSSEVLLVYGDSDESTPVDYVAEIVSGTELKCLVIPGGNHDIGEKYPEEISQAIIDFLSK